MPRQVGNLWAGLERINEIWRFNTTTLTFEAPPVQLPSRESVRDIILGPTT